MQIYQQIGQYWGRAAGHERTVNVGAFVLLLFVLGLFIVNSPMKWHCLRPPSCPSCCHGAQLHGLHQLLHRPYPHVCQFRTVASILVIAEFTIPLLAMLTLKKIVDGLNF
jgi:hypothetical protein